MATDERRSGESRVIQRVLDHVSTAALVVVAAVVLGDFLKGRSEQPSNVKVPTDALNLDGAPRLGSGTAPVGLLIFSDFECAYCAQFATTTLATLKTRYVEQGRLQVAFRHYFNRDSHRLAEQLAELAVCAIAQDRFWETHDRIFALLGPMQPSSITRVKEEFSGDLAQLETCLHTNDFRQLAEDRRIGQRLGLLGTPTSFVGRVTESGRLQVAAVIEGNRSLSVFENTIESLIR